MAVFFRTGEMLQTCMGDHDVFEALLQSHGGTMLAISRGQSSMTIFNMADVLQGFVETLANMVVSEIRNSGYQDKGALQKLRDSWRFRHEGFELDGPKMATFLLIAEWIEDDDIVFGQTYLAILEEAHNLHHGVGERAANCARLAQRTNLDARSLFWRCFENHFEVVKKLIQRNRTEEER